MAVGIGQMVSEALPLSDEMVKFLIAALVAGVLIVLFYMLRYWLTGRK